MRCRWALAVVASMMLATGMPAHGSLVRAAGQVASQGRAAGKLSVSPSIGVAGTIVTLNSPAGTLPPGAIAEVNFADPAGSYAGVPVGRGLVNPDGAISFQVMLVAQSTPGPATIFVTANGVTISTTFTVLTAITVNPQTTQADSTAQVIGSGFGPNHSITFFLADTQGITQTINPLASVPIVTDLFGTFIASVSIPKNTVPGLLTLHASDSTYAASTPLQVTGLAGAPTTLPDATPMLTASVTATPTATAGIPTSSASASPTMVASTSPVPLSGGPTTAYFAEGYTGQAASNGKATFMESLNILNPGESTVPLTITYYLQNSPTPLVVTRLISATTSLRESVNADVGPDRVVAAVLNAPGRLAVSRTINRVSAAGTRLDGSTTQPASAPGLSWGFPEGYTGFSFQEYLTVLNPSPATAHVSVVLAPQGASATGARTLALTIPAQSRSTANIRALNAGNPASSVGMLVKSDVPIVPERVEYFGDGSGSGKFGSTVTMGIGAPSTQLRLAFGSSGGSQPNGRGGLQPAGNQDYITVLNPAADGAPVAVTARFSDAHGLTIGQTALSLASGTRSTIVANTILGTTAVEPFSVALSAAAPIEAESAQYFGGSPNSGMHPGVAFPAQAGAADDVFLTDLSTALADGTTLTRTVYLYNPGTSPLSVNATFFGSSAPGAQFTFDVPAGAIVPVPVNGGAPALPGGPLGGEFRLANGSTGSFLAYALGQTADGLSATEEVGMAP